MSYRNNKQNRMSRKRRGISILEVLFSIGVATIGLFGVLVMIPFAVRQANIGLNLDRTMDTGRNAIAEFEIRGYHDPTSWYLEDGVSRIPINGLDSYVIDPVMVGNAYTDLGVWPNLQFPYVETPGSLPPDMFPSGSDVTLPDGRPSLQRITLSRFDPTGPGTIWLSKAKASQLTTNRDDVIFKIKDNETVLEDEFAVANSEYMDLDGVISKRQFSGNFSWMAYVRPEAPGLSVSRYAISLIVMHQRESTRDIGGTPAYGRFDRVFDVNAASFNGGKIISGGEIQLDSEHFVAPADPEEQKIKSGDWIALTNAAYGLRWYQITQVDDLDDQDPAVASDPGHGTWRMTIQGPDFLEAATPTYAIYVPGVMNVYRKTFKTESSSSWMPQ